MFMFRSEILCAFLILVVFNLFVKCHLSCCFDVVSVVLYVPSANTECYEMTLSRLLELTTKNMETQVVHHLLTVAFR